MALRAHVSQLGRNGIVRRLQIEHLENKTQRTNQNKSTAEKKLKRIKAQ